MATILIVENRPIDRKLLTGVLRMRGHDIVETSDGQEALETLAHISPDVVISDILMPTVDGHEFVRRMREIPALAATPVIFYTPAYHEREARALAHQSAVIDVLTKPSPPQVIVATVDAALATKPRPQSLPLDAYIDREDVRLVRSRLAAVDRLEAEKERLKAVLEVAEQIAGQRDPLALLNIVCTEGRHVTLAQHAVVGLLTEEGSPGETLYTSGLDAATKVSMKPPSVGGDLLSTVVHERRPVRTRNPDGRPEALGLPADHPTVSSLLSVPIASASRVYGWLCLRNKLGTEEFTELDERVALTLGAHAGIAYENAHLINDLHRRVTTLELELNQTAARVREEERAQLSRTLHDQLGQLLAGMKIDMHWLAAELALINGLSRDDITGKVGSVVQRLGETIEFVRTTASELRPAVLDELGLLAAIEWQAAEFERRSGIRCRLDTRIDEIDLDRARATAVFRIVQEALMNVLRHAEATHATVTVRRLIRFLNVSVTDNGRGISDRDLANGSSLGLAGMRERATLLGGRLDVRRRSPSGTMVRLTVPLTGTRAARG
jgi:signal transduction histidine kinase/CheY-like chemotaxis protein